MCSFEKREEQLFVFLLTFEMKGAILINIRI